MSSQAKTRVLIGLAAVLAVILIVNLMPAGGPVAPGAAAADQQYKAIAVENPALHLDRIERLRKLEYKPTGRDIFTAELPKPVEVKQPEPYRPQGPTPPPPEPPLTVPFKFYGFSQDPATGKKQGFFNSSDDVFIVGEGDLVLGKYRIVSIGSTVAEVEEVSSGKRVKLNLEAGGSAPSGGASEN